uniref:Uncharacterized protein n=1 Tax=Chlamydomonas euryale TaxID=1486919 RepID=A0A6U2HBW9_9CHLO
MSQLWPVGMSYPSAGAVIQASRRGAPPAGVARHASAAMPCIREWRLDAGACGLLGPEPAAPQRWTEYNMLFASEDGLAECVGQGSSSGGASRGGADTSGIGGSSGWCDGDGGSGSITGTGGSGSGIGGGVKGIGRGSCIAIGNHTGAHAPPPHSRAVETGSDAARLSAALPTSRGNCCGGGTVDGIQGGCDAGGTGGRGGGSGAGAGAGCDAVARSASLQGAATAWLPAGGGSSAGPRATDARLLRLHASLGAYFGSLPWHTDA